MQLAIQELEELRKRHSKEFLKKLNRALTDCKS